MSEEPRKVFDRARFFYFERPDEPPFSSYSSPRRVASSTRIPISREHVDTHSPPAVNRPPSNASTTSSTTRSTNSDVSNRESPTSTVASKASQPPAGYIQPPSLNQQLASAAYDYANDEPCHFGFPDCDLRDCADEFENWIAHAASHFPHSTSPPSKAVCMFCDVEFDGAESENSAHPTLWERMLHIRKHLQDLTSPAIAQPVLSLIEGMYANDFISHDQYVCAIQYTGKDWLFPLDYETQEMKIKRERNSQEYHNLDKERRAQKKEAQKDKDKGKGKEVHQQSQVSRRSRRPPTVRQADLRLVPNTRRRSPTIP